jgi:hypothetical protein
MKKVFVFKVKDRYEIEKGINKNYRLTIEVVLDSKKSGECLSICGSIYYRNSFITGGQIFDDIKGNYVATDKDKLILNKILYAWNHYHLNDLHAGTEKQEEALKNFEGSRNYDSDCQYLKTVGLYDDNGYRYGTGWLFRAIPEDVLKEIKELILS